MVRLVDDVLRDHHRFGVSDGLASEDVNLADPAMGTGTFLLGVLQRISERVAGDQVEGAVPAAIPSTSLCAFFSRIHSAIRTKSMSTSPPACYPWPNQGEPPIG
jgi:hypothetical protein